MDEMAVNKLQAQPWQLKLQTGPFKVLSPLAERTSTNFYISRPCFLGTDSVSSAQGPWEKSVLEFGTVKQKFL